MTNTTLDDISAVIGFTAAIRIAAFYGGRDLHVPVEVSDKHPIAKLIGVNRLLALANEWRGERLSIPSLNCIEVETRNAKILLLLLNNVDRYTIASVMGIGERRISQISKEFKKLGIL
jgi:hypothetical protein